MGFPGLVIDDNGVQISGHVFSSENFQSHWARLDEFEGGEYVRVMATVFLTDGTSIDAFVYTLR